MLRYRVVHVGRVQRVQSAPLFLFTILKKRFHRIEYEKGNLRYERRYPSSAHRASP